MLAELPDWFDLGFMRGITIGAAVTLGIGVLACLVFVRKLMPRLALAAVLAALAGGLVFYRTTLQDCSETCSCKLLGSPLDSDTCPSDFATNE